MPLTSTGCTPGRTLQDFRGSCTGAPGLFLQLLDLCPPAWTSAPGTLVPLVLPAAACAPLPGPLPFPALACVGGGGLTLAPVLGVPYCWPLTRARQLFLWLWLLVSHLGRLWGWGGVCPTVFLCSGLFGLG